MILRQISIFLIAMSAWTNAWAGDGDALTRALREELADRFPGARIEINGAVHITRGSNATEEPVAIQNITPRGEAVFSGPGADGWISFSAWIPAQVAIKRIQPGQILAPEQFTIQNVNVAMGMAFEYRGVIVGKETQIKGLEARQTVLEGQFLTSTAVQRIPDVRRGDSVRIQLISGDLVISTMGSVEEPGYLNGRVHVLASKTKREFVGSLLPGGIVQVKL